jgi:hypothetical protein
MIELCRALHVEIIPYSPPHQGSSIPSHDTKTLSSTSTPSTSSSLVDTIKSEIEAIATNDSKSSISKSSSSTATLPLPYRYTHTSSRNSNAKFKPLPDVLPPFNQETTTSNGDTIDEPFQSNDNDDLSSLSSLPLDNGTLAQTQAHYQPQVELHQRRRRRHDGHDTDDRKETMTTNDVASSKPNTNKRARINNDNSSSNS